MAEDPFARWDHFSATRTGGPIVRDPLKIYRLGSQVRTEHDEQVYITNLKDLSSVAFLNNKCVRMTLPDGPVYPFDAQLEYQDFKLEREEVAGEETVDGHVCTVEKLNYTRIGNEAQYIKMTLWKAKDLDGFPIKIDVLPNIRKTPFTFHYSDVSLKAPDAALFKVPAHCEMLSGAMANTLRTKDPAAKGKAPAAPAAKPPAKPNPSTTPPSGSASKPQ